MSQTVPQAVCAAGHEGEIEELSMEILERYEEVNLLYRMCESFSHVFEEREILESLMDEALRAVHGRAGWVSVLGYGDEPETVLRHSLASRPGDAHRSLQRAEASAAPVSAFAGPEPSWGASAGPGEPERPAEAAALGLARRAIAENRILSVEGVVGAEGTEPPLLALPMSGKTGSIGAMILEKPAYEQAFRSGDVRLAAAVASFGAAMVENRRLARAMKKAERIKGEIEIARTIQQGLLPSEDPCVRGLQISGLCRPAEDIGGDYFGYARIRPDRFGMMIADVSGHSIGAAIGMVIARCLIQSEAHRSTSPSWILSRVNELLNRDLTDPGMFVTTFLAVYDESSGRISYANAGHNPPLLYRAGTGAVTTLQGAGLGLGIDTDTEYSDFEDRLSAGDVLVLYTDGVTEARSASGEMFGVRRLEETVREFQGLEARAAVEAIAERVASWTGHGAFTDDLTLVLAKRLPDSEGAP